jgi:hypothetical protein
VGVAALVTAVQLWATGPADAAGSCTGPALQGTGGKLTAKYTTSVAGTYILDPVENIPNAPGLIRMDVNGAPVNYPVTLQYTNVPAGTYHVSVSAPQGCTNIANTLVTVSAK